MALSEDVGAALAANDLAKARALTRLAIRVLRQQRSEAVAEFDAKIERAEGFLAASREAARNQERVRRMLLLAGPQPREDNHGQEA